MATNNQLNLPLSGNTGTGNFVGANTPTLITPNIGVATATSVNKLLITAPATSATLAIADGKSLTVSNILTFTGTDTSSIAFGAGGTVIYSGGSPTFAAITFSPTTGGIVGTTTNDNAAAGKVGEYFTTAVTGSPVSITNNTSTNMAQITNLPAGDWDVSGIIAFQTASTTVVTAVNAWISSSSATLPSDSSTISRADAGSAGVSNVGTGITLGLAIAQQRFSLAAPTTIYISGYATFATSTMNMVGYISARRVR